MGSSFSPVALAARRGFRAIPALIALLWLACGAAAALAQDRDLSGWWQAEIEHGRDRATVYLHLGAAGGRPRATITVPAARMRDVAIGPYEITAGHLRLPGLDWALSIADDGQRLDGTLPQSLAPQPLAVRLQRGPGPPPAAEPAAARPAPTPLWRVSVGAEVWAGLALDRRRRLLFVAADNGRLTALAAGTGAQVWTADLGAPIRATPTLRDDRLYVATDSALVALDPRSGARLWSFAFEAQRAPRRPISDGHSQWDHYSASATIHGLVAVVAGRDGCIHALDARTGTAR